MAKVDEVAPLAADVAGAHKRYTAAMDEARAAEAAILARVVDDVRDALPALVSRVDALPHPAACIVKTRQDALYLTAEWGWYEILDDVAKPIHFGHVHSAVLEAGWGLPSVVDGIMKRLREQAQGRKGEATEALEARAARLAAVLELVK